MKSKKQKNSMKGIMIIFSLIVLNLNVLAYIMGNFSENIFCKECENKLTMNTFVIDGGAYFLQGYSEILQILNKVEMSDLQGLEYSELKKNIVNAIDYMNNTKSKYISLVEMAEVTPYNLEVLQKLNGFDYNNFQKENNLNKTILKDVSSFLSKGDINGFYSRILENTIVIINELYSIKASVDTNSFPNLSTLWSLNHTCSTTLLFGQYAAEIMYNITYEK